MKRFSKSVLAIILLGMACLCYAESDGARVKAWQGTVTIGTYPWQEDVNPKFWAMEGAASLSTTVKGSITYPYTMQDHLSRTKVDRTYKALFLENEYLKIICLPELGGRLHSVFDKTEGKETFHLNRVIKPSMIAMRGAFISGGVEWNAGPHVHTVTIVSPVDALLGENPDGSAYLEVSNQEMIFRTRWTVRVTLHPGKAYLDERIRIFNPTDEVHPYYFWNCTAFPSRPGTRFIYPMTLGTDHHGRKFFSWPIHDGKDISWLKNYETSSSVFAVGCEFDFFGAYDVDDDRGVVQVANHRELSGKKAWTWGTWDFGRVCQQNLTDDDGAYIEVQSGPLPTQSDYGMLVPRDQVAWQEWWYPVHGLGDGFEFATKDLAIQTSRGNGGLQLRLLATGVFPEATCTVSSKGQKLLEKQLDLSPVEPGVVTLAPAPKSPVEVSVQTNDGVTLAEFVTPLPIPKVVTPDPSKFAEKADDELTVEQTYLKGRKFDLASDRLKARQYYEMALKADAGHVPSLRALAVLDLEAGLYDRAAARLDRALKRDASDGLSWYFLGVCRWRLGDDRETLRCAYHAARSFGTTSLGYDLAGRAHMRLSQPARAVEAFGKAVHSNPKDSRARDHLTLALYACGKTGVAWRRAQKSVAERPTDLVPRALLALRDRDAMVRFTQEARAFVGEDDFELLETALVFARLGLLREASRLLQATCVDAVRPRQRSPLPLYYLAHFASLRGDTERAQACLRSAAAIDRDLVFASRAEAVEVLKYAVEQNAADAHAHLHLGNLYADLGRLDEAVPCWQRAAKLDSSASMPLRNLALAAWALDSDLTKAASLYRKAVAARPQDQTLYRDLAGSLVADGKRPEAIALLSTMPYEKMRRADIIIMLVEAYLDEKRFTECIDLLESTPYFVNWEGQDITRKLFTEAHMQRGRIRLKQGESELALEDFEAALTYPENLGVGRSNRPQEAPAQYFKGKALQAMGRLAEARSAWQEGAAGSKGSQEQEEHRQLCEEALAATR